MFETILPYVYGRTLEIGSGIGNISNQFVQAGLPITVTDLDNSYCRMLHDKFDGQKLVEGIYQMDLAHAAFDTAYAHLIGKFDTVFALNVVEHIEDDKRALSNAKSLLTRGGQVIILVPAYNTLYNTLDKALDHYRRYDRNSIKQLLQGEGFEIIHTQYFNLAGIPGWFFAGAVQGHNTLPAGQLSIYDKMVPLFKIADALTFHQIGLSVIAVGRKR
jgi:SAM-dependent methyltransferase